MITSPENPKVRIARSLLEQKGRETQGHCLVEGVRLIEDAMRAGVTPALVFFVSQVRASSRAAAVLAEAARRGAPLLEVDDRVLGTLTDTVTSQGIIAELVIPRPPLPDHPDFVLVLDQVRDPGNMGTILRSAEAAGASVVVLAPGCVDPWNPKVVRSGMGAHFRLSIYAPRAWLPVETMLQGYPVWLAEAQGAVAYDVVDWTIPCSLVVGGEANGFSENARRIGTGRVAIPMAGGAESLNAAMAATVLVFEMARQRRRTHRGPRDV